MTKQETAKVLAVLQAAYPSFYRGMSSQEVDSVIAVWASMFEQEPYAVVCAAVKTLIASDTKGYPPHIGAVKGAIQRITEPDAPTEAEAWNIVIKAASDAAYGAQAQYEKLPPIIKQTVGSAETLRNIALAESDTLTVLQSNFMRSYRERSARERERARMPEDVKRIAEGGTTKMIGG